MDFTMVFSVALAAALIVIVLMLVAVIVYQRWRIGEKNAALGRFIRENLELSDELKNK
jgi:cbb3-type cytochrome oxidase subunit 3